MLPQRYAIPVLATLGFAVTLALTFPRQLTPGNVLSARTAAAGADRLASPPPVAVAARQSVGRAPSGGLRLAAASKAQLAPDSNSEPAAPALPVHMDFPTAGEGTRKVRIASFGEDPLEIHVEVLSPASGEHGASEIALNPHQQRTADGVHAERGDQVTLHAPGYADLTRTIL